MHQISSFACSRYIAAVSTFGRSKSRDRKCLSPLRIFLWQFYEIQRYYGHLKQNRDYQPHDKAPLQDLI